MATTRMLQERLQAPKRYPSSMNHAHIAHIGPSAVKCNENYTRGEFYAKSLYVCDVCMDMEARP